MTALGCVNLPGAALTGTEPRFALCMTVTVD